nr:hypothetical protein CFP56_65876 [Quercus suber]
MATVPPGYHPPFAAVTPTDHRAWIIIATALGMVTALASGVIRLSVRSQFGQKAGIDDMLLGAGIVIAVIQEGVVLGATSVGLGRTIDDLSPAHLRSVEKTFYAANILSMFTLALCKWSVAWFILRLTPVRSQQKLVYAVCWAIGIWLVLAVFLLALQCDLGHPWVLVGEAAACTGLFARHVTVATLDIVLEVALLAVVVYLVTDLQTASWNKVVALIAFAFRLPLIAIIGLRLHKFDRVGSDFSLGNAIYLVLTETQLNYSIISATIPIMRPFFNSLVTHYGVGNVPNYAVTNRDGNHTTHDRSLEMSALRSGISRGTHWITTLGSGVESRNRDLPDDFGVGGTNDAYAYHDEKRSHATSAPVGDDGEGSKGQVTEDGSVDSLEYQGLYIRRDVQWVVHTEDADRFPPNRQHGKSHSRGASTDRRHHTGTQILS